MKLHYRMFKLQDASLLKLDYLRTAMTIDNNLHIYQHLYYLENCLCNVYEKYFMF